MKVFQQQYMGEEKLVKKAYEQGQDFAGDVIGLFEFMMEKVRAGEPIMPQLFFVCLVDGKKQNIPLIEGCGDGSLPRGDDMRRVIRHVWREVQARVKGARLVAFVFGYDAYADPVKLKPGEKARPWTDKDRAGEELFVQVSFAEEEMVFGMRYERSVDGSVVFAPSLKRYMEEDKLITEYGGLWPL